MDKLFEGMQFLTGRVPFLGQIQQMPNYLRPLDLFVYIMRYKLNFRKKVTNANPLSITGAGFSEREAKEKCLGEAIERFCWAHAHLWKNLIFGNYKKFQKKAISPDKFALFSNSQYKKHNFPFQRFKDDLNIYWLEGINLVTKKEVLVPAQLCLPTTRDRNRISFSTTTGLSAHRDYYKCLYNCLCEVVERDAVMITWLNKFNLVPLKINGDLVLSGLSKKLNVSDYKLMVYLLPTDVDLNVVLSINVNRRNKSPFLAMGASCSFSFLHALRKAVLEGFHCLNFLFYAKKEGKIIKDWRQIKGFDEHALLYSNPIMREKISFLIAGEKKEQNKIAGKSVLKNRQVLNFKQMCQVIINNLSKKGYQPIVVDLTPEEIKLLGFHVLKVLIPGFIDLGLYNFYFLGSERIYKISSKYGFGIKKEEELNTFPHPFP